jgi:hypothetical protein
MHSIDLNLLMALDALLDDGTVVGAAKRMNLSAPAMSRSAMRFWCAPVGGWCRRPGRLSFAVAFAN